MAKCKYVFSPEEYRDLRLLMTPEGQRKLVDRVAPPNRNKEPLQDFQERLAQWSLSVIGLPEDR